MIEYSECIVNGKNDKSYVIFRCFKHPILVVCNSFLCRVPEFEVSKYLVSNREFYEFVKDGGYQRKELWTEEGNSSLLS